MTVNQRLHNWILNEKWWYKRLSFGKFSWNLVFERWAKLQVRPSWLGSLTATHYYIISTHFGKILISKLTSTLNTILSIQIINLTYGFGYFILWKMTSVSNYVPLKNNLRSVYKLSSNQTSLAIVITFSISHVMIAVWPLTPFICIHLKLIEIMQLRSKSEAFK